MTDEVHRISVNATYTHQLLGFDEWRATRQDEKKVENTITATSNGDVYHNSQSVLRRPQRK